MKLVTYNYQNENHLGIFHNDNIYSLHDIDGNLPDDMLTFLQQGEDTMEKAKLINNAIVNNGKYPTFAIPVTDAQLLAPITNPTSCRDGYAFRQHVAAARKNRGVEMIPEFDEYPIFYFTNHNAIQGEGDINLMPDHFEKLDFELEVAVVLGKKGRNIPAAEADQYIAGYVIMNDMSARALQMEEMKLNLGPAKGKDFSTVIGPWLVTPDELEQYKVPAKPGHVGNNYDLNMKCWVNGILLSEGSMATMDWTFAEIIERCAYGVDVYPGDVIGSGTVGTGCLLELNGTAKRLNPDATPQWLQPNDVVEMEITGLGHLSNTMRKEDSNMSLFALKKKAQGNV
jgi:fumarylacetoacetate (FAA) hydrolase